MTQEQIIEGNKLIGNYLGKNFSDPLNYMYDKSWDWLMPVVEKCYTSVDALDWYSSDLTLFDLGINADINIVYNAVVEFIKWYNSK